MPSSSPDGRSRRAFLLSSGALAAGAALSGRSPAAAAPRPQDAAGRAAAADEAETITATTVAEAQKLAAVELSDAEREAILPALRRRAAGYVQRRDVALVNGTGPAHVFDPRLPGTTVDLEQRVVRSDADPGPVPADDVGIAFAPVTALSRWIERGQLTSERLARICLDRLRRIGPRLECVITLTEELALEQARRADAELAAGRYRGPLHGIPWGAKDLLDTAGIPTTWGAMPYKDRVPETDAAVVRMLADAGAVLVAKLTLGAL
ncbi:MAG: amidase family protein, partial [Planctomycetota bacterium]